MSKNMYVFPLSDLHLGSNHCNLDFFYEWCRKFEKAPDNKVIYLLGDLLEFPSTRVDAYDVALTTHEALERLIELLEPYKEYIRWVCTGNHEARSLKDFNYDITKQIASRLDAKYTRNDFFDKIIEDDSHKLIWECPNCGNRDFHKMNIARRVCGYIGTNEVNQGRLQEYDKRVIHLT